MGGKKQTQVGLWEKIKLQKKLRLGLINFFSKNLKRKKKEKPCT
jgi:hypothetical protein